MNVSESPESLKQIARMLNARKRAGGPPTVLFLGSRAGSLFRRPSLVDQLKGFSNRDMLNMTPIERFHECYQIIEDEFRKQNKDNDIHFIIRTTLKEKPLDIADLCIAELMKQDIFDLIITTNIGNELERAFHQRGMEDPYDFEIILPRSGGFIASKIEKDKTFQMLKAYGDFASKRYSIYGYNIEDSKEFFLEKYPELKMSLEQLKKEEMLMVGFDYRWDRHLLPSIFPRKSGSLWYINEEQTKADSELFSYLEDSNANCIENPIGEYEPFFVNLCKALDIDILDHPTISNEPTDNNLVLKEVRVLQNDLSRLSLTIDNLLPYQEAIMDIKGDIKNKLTSNDTLLNEVRVLQNDLSRLSQTVDKLLPCQEAMLDIKDNIKAEIRDPQDALPTQSPPPAPTSSNSNNFSAFISKFLQKSKPRSTRKGKPYEENEK